MKTSSRQARIESLNHLGPDYRNTLVNYYISELKEMNLDPTAAKLVKFTCNRCTSGFEASATDVLKLERAFYNTLGLKVI